MSRPVRTCRTRRAAGALAVALLLGGGAAACGSPAPKASNAIPPAAVADADPVVWAAFGGDETLIGDADGASAAWIQQVLAELPASAQLLELATEDATVDQALGGPLASLRASAVVPTVATVWFGSADRDTSSARFTESLTRLVDALRGLGIPRVVLVSRPAGPGATRAADVAAVAAATGAPLVTVDGLTGNPRDPTAQDAIAAAVGPAVRG